MPRYAVEITRSISVTVSVTADTAEAAVAAVDNRRFPLPEPAAWSAHKDWRYLAVNEADPADTHEEG